jgi:hypothetical protein
VPAGKVNLVDSKVQIIELTDGTLYHPVSRTSTVLKVTEQPIDAATLRKGTWVVIDPNPAIPLETPSAIPADTIAAGRMLRVLPR